MDEPVEGDDVEDVAAPEDVRKRLIAVAVVAILIVAVGVVGVYLALVRTPLRSGTPVPVAAPSAPTAAPAEADSTDTTYDLRHGMPSEEKLNPAPATAVSENQPSPATD